MADEEALIGAILTAAWNPATVAMPDIYYDDSVRAHNYASGPSIKIYSYYSNLKPSSLGWIDQDVVVRLTVDLKSSDRANIMLCRGELIRCLQTARKAPSADFDKLKLNDKGKKLAGFVGWWHYAFDVTLQKYCEAI